MTPPDSTPGQGLRPQAGHRVRAVALSVAGGYLVVGTLIGLLNQPQQMWRCADPGSSTGIINYSTPRPSCTPTVSLRERAAVFGTLLVLWLPLGVAQGMTHGAAMAQPMPTPVASW